MDKKKFKELHDTYAKEETIKLLDKHFLWIAAATLLIVIGIISLVPTPLFMAACMLSTAYYIYITYVKE